MTKPTSRRLRRLLIPRGPTRATIMVSITPIIIMPSWVAATGAESAKSVRNSLRVRPSSREVVDIGISAASSEDSERRGANAPR